MKHILSYGHKLINKWQPQNFLIYNKAALKGFDIKI